MFLKIAEALFQIATLLKKSLDLVQTDTFQLGDHIRVNIQQVMSRNLHVSPDDNHIFGLNH